MHLLVNFDLVLANKVSFMGCSMYLNGMKNNDLSIR